MVSSSKTITSSSSRDSSGSSVFFFGTFFPIRSNTKFLALSNANWTKLSEVIS